MFVVTGQIDTQSVDNVIFALQALGANRLPATAMAVMQATQLAQQRWIDNSTGAFKRSTGDYLQGILDGLEYPYDDDVYKGAVVNASRHAKWIEEGTSAWDMKKMLFTSAQVRISAKGKRYLIIPFRHGTPSAGSQEGGRGINRATLSTMPQSVYKMVRAMAPSRQLTGMKVPNPAAGGRAAIRYTYHWGGKLKASDLAAAGVDQTNRRPHWKSSPYTGMVRFPRESSTGQHTYLTFRVMHEDSKGWLHPGTPPKWLAKKTATEIEAAVVRLIEIGFDTDMRNFLGQA